MRRDAAKVATDRRLAERLRRAREAAGLSLREAARRAGWSVGRIQQYEGGQTSPTVDALYAVAAIYEVDPLDLLRGRGERMVAPPPEGMTWPTGIEAEWVRLWDGSRALVARGRRNTPGMHAVEVEGRRVVGWVEKDGSRYKVMVQPNQGWVTVSARDIIGQSMGLWRPHK